MESMPNGMYLLFHDEIKGPAIKCSFFTTALILPQEFISKLYMSHAGFGTSSSMELKFEGYRNVSLFTGHVARQAQKEGILGIVFEENEEFGNLELFLQRTLNLAINYPDNQTMEFIFTRQLLPYLGLNKIFEGVQVEQIPEIFIMTGDREYRSCLLRLGENRVSNPELSDLYKKIIEKHASPQYQFVELKSPSDKHTFLVFKTKKSYEIAKIQITMKPYLDAYFNYALEILALFLLPSEIKMTELNKSPSRKDTGKSKSVLQVLQKSGYEDGFNKMITSLIKGETTLTSVFEEEPEPEISQA
jgi:hypothetical protein